MESKTTAECVHWYEAARVGHDVNWWQCSNCGKLRRREAAEWPEAGQR